MSRSNLLSRHGLALLCVARNADSRLREIGDFVGFTERAAHSLMRDLVESGYVARSGSETETVMKWKRIRPCPKQGLGGLRLGELVAALNPDSPGTNA